MSDIITVNFIIKEPNKLLAKKVKVTETLSPEQIKTYFAESATPYDLSYIYEHRNKNDDINVWIQKIVKYNSNNFSLKTWTTLSAEIADEDLDKFREVLTEIASKHDNLIKNNLIYNRQL